MLSDSFSIYRSLSEKRQELMAVLSIRSAVAVTLALAIAVRAFRHRSLDLWGAIAGFLVMTIHIAAGYRFGARLLVFFFTSSKLTKMGEEKKRSIDEDFKAGGQRNWYYACCNGDTWSSEIGVLSNAQPRLITKFKTVRRGTNVAVSVEGLLAATGAGLIIGLTSVIIGFFTAEPDAVVAWEQLLLIPIAAAAGLGGSLIDSLLGATLQFSGYCKVRKMAD